MERTPNTFLVIVIMVIVLLAMMWWARRGKPKASRVSNPIPLWRRWRPADPSRCDCCRAEVGQMSPPSPISAVEAWSTRRSKRGRKKLIDSSGHYCPNPECRYYLNRDAASHALVSNGHHGVQAIRQWVCQACGSYVSERHDTAMSHLKTPLADVANALDLLNRGNSQADTAEHRGHDPRSVRLWLKRAAAQAMRVHDADFQNLNLGHLQLDELFSHIKGDASRHCIWIALDAVTKIIPVWHIGGRRLQDAQVVVHQLKRRLASDCIPIFTSDQLRAYFTTLTSHFGEFRQVFAHRTPIWHVSPKLLFAMVVKIRSGKRFKYAFTLPIFGTRGQIRDALQALGLSGRINTAYVERVNLSLRQLIAALHRKPFDKLRALPWSRTTLDHRFTWFCVVYHFVRPHMGLAGFSINGRAFKACSPAIAAGLTDHLWSIADLLTWRPSPVLT